MSNHTGQCEHPGCTMAGDACFMDTEREEANDVSGYYCSEHAKDYGFCYICGQFWGGIESFEFLHPGVCDNCHAELDEHDDEDLDFYE